MQTLQAELSTRLLWPPSCPVSYLRTAAAAVAAEVVDIVAGARFSSH